MKILLADALVIRGQVLLRRVREMSLSVGRSWITQGVYLLMTCELSHITSDM